MPEYLSPGVYVEEIPSGNKPIQGVGTSTGAFVGLAGKGPIGEATLIGNRAELFATFGPFLPGVNLTHAVNLFFLNGGTRCYVVRTCAHTGVTRQAVASTLMVTDGANNALRIDAHSPGEWGDEIAVTIEHPNAAPAFSLGVFYRGEPVVVYDGLVLDPNAATSAEELINDVSKTIRVDANPDALPALPGRPQLTPQQNLAAGADGLTGVVSSDLTGADGLLAFDPIDGVNIVAIPDSSRRDVMLAGLNYCEQRGDCFFIAHAPETTDTAAEALAYKQATGSEFSGQNAFNSSYGALYVPWLEISDPLGGSSILVPPVGAVAGRYSATDVKRGVHKVAAGIEDGLLSSVLRLSHQLSRAEIEVLNPNHVNVLRRADGVGNVIWGARTLSADPELRYLSTRRLLLFIEESIAEGTRWVVFEPNTPDLWKSIERNVRAFLRVVWRSGALFGATEDQAFHVSCNAETNPPDSIAEGKVITEIAVAIVKPAEFVIFRISQSKAGAEIGE